MTTPRLRHLRLLAGIAFAVSAAACNDFLKVTNPGAIEVDKIADSSYAALLVNGTISEFQNIATRYALYQSVFTDETRNHHVFVENRDIDRRVMTEATGLNATEIYNPLQRARFIADTSATLLKGYGIGPTQSDTLNRRIAIARVLAYSGYSHVLLGEAICDPPIDRSAPLPADTVFGRAVSRFTESITYASQARAGALSPAQTALADSMLSFARVGLARAELNRNNLTAAAAAASQVPATFEFRVYHSANSARENNPFFNAASQASVSTWIALEPKWKGLGDPRIPMPTNPEAVMNGARPDTVGAVSGAFVPNAPSSFSGWNGTVTGVDFTMATSMRLASGLEAQYIVAEAAGPVPTTLTFVNARRAVGLQTPVNLTGDALMAELRNQRARDFFMDGHRLGDLRRYIRFRQVDEFPKGAYPGSTSGEQYGTATCFPISQGERNANPNLPKVP